MSEKMTLEIFWEVFAVYWLFSAIVMFGYWASGTELPKSKINWLTNISGGFLLIFMSFYYVPLFLGEILYREMKRL